MENLWWFLGTVFVYFVAHVPIAYNIENDWHLYKFKDEWFTAKSFLRRLEIIALLCLPININGHVFTVLGNAVSEKSNWSVFSVYQKAGTHVVSVIGLFQEAKGNAFSVVSLSQKADNALSMLSLCQRTDDAAITVFSFFNYQRSENKNVFSGVGITSAQIAPQGEAALAVGVAGYQKAKEVVSVPIGIAGYQQANECEVGLGVAGRQKSNRLSIVSIGFAGYQQSEKRLWTAVGIALFQQVPGASRIFGAFTPLTAPDAVETPETPNFEVKTLPAK